MALCYQPNIVIQDLKLAYDAANPKCYAGVGTFVNDLSGNNNRGYLYNGVTYSSNLTGYFNFDGSNDYIGTNFQPNYDYITVNVWFWSGAFSTFGTNTCVVANSQVSSPYPSFDIRKRNTGALQLQFAISSSGSEIGQEIGFINDYTWYNVQFTYDGNTVKCWLNGVQVVNYSIVGTLRNSTSNLFIAKNPAFAGRNAAINVSQLFVYNRALTESEIQRNYNATKQRYIYTEDVISDGLVSAFDIGSALSYTGSGSRIYNALSSLGGTADLRDGATIAGSGSSAYINLSGSSANVVAFSPNTFLSMSMLVWITTSQYYVYYLLDGRNDIAGSYYYAPDGGGYTNLYVNGVKKTVVGLSNNTVFPRDQWLHIYLELPSLSTGTMYFGNRFSFNEPLSGRLSAIQFYNRSLSPAEIKQNYQALRGRYGI